MLHLTACIRCGKMRVVAKTWTEVVGTSTLTRTLTVCPDSECQKIVEDQLEKKNERLRLVQEQSLKRRSHFKRKRTDIVLK